MGGGDFSVDLYDTEKWTRRYGIRPLSLSLHALTSAGLDHLLRWRPDGPVPFVQVARFRRFLIVIACFALCPLMPRPLLDDAFALTRSDDARDDAERARDGAQRPDLLGSARSRCSSSSASTPSPSASSRRTARTRPRASCRRRSRSAPRRGPTRCAGARRAERRYTSSKSARPRYRSPARASTSSMLPAAAGRNDPCADTSAHARVSSQPVATVHRTPALVLRGGGAS